MSRVEGVVVGTVASVEDPQGEGRIQVEFPWMGGRNRSYWAPNATMMAGGGRGSWFMPETGDEVLVAFDHGDVQHPFVIGFLWNGVDQPPAPERDASVRRLRTVAGHVIEFDDNPGAERVRIETAAGHSIELVDQPGRIEIKTVGGQAIELADTPPSLSATAAGTKIDVDATGVSVATPGKLSVTCTTATVTSSAATTVTAPALTFNAPLTVFSGVVQATTVTAGAVAAGAYTPAPGDTLGL